MLVDERKNAENSTVPITLSTKNEIMAPKDHDETGPPGAGTLFVYDPSRGPDGHSWDAVPTTRPGLIPSPDQLLVRGIADYSYIPHAQGGVLGRGKFSTVYRVTSGGHEYALKHTPLHPHHPLIAARLLREPTLLAHLAPHPCLIGVEGFVRTEGHFYLVEECASHHVPLPQHSLPLSPSRAAYILDQLVSVVRDCLHAGRVCHRDLKGDNVLIDVETGDILLLDLGLATHYSASEPRLTTCCGSPAFHSPEIIHALNHRPGEVTYYGPELDIWCIALTMLALLVQTRFPLGPTHTSRTIMGERAHDCLQLLDDLYPPQEPWRALGPVACASLSDEEKREHETNWPRVREALRGFVEIDARRRMAAFAHYDVGPQVRSRVQQHAMVTANRTFKTTTFVPSEVKYVLPLYLEPCAPDVPLVLRNPTREPEKRILSYLKYLLRCAGILYHHLPDTHPAVIQLVLPLGPPPPPQPAIPSPLGPTPARPEGGWVTNLLGLRRPPPRSVSVPPTSTRSPAQGPTTDTRGKKAWAQQAWLRVEVERAHSRAPSSSGSRPPLSRMPSRAPSRMPSRPGSRQVSRTRTLSTGATGEDHLTAMDPTLHNPQLAQTSRTKHTPRPSPLTRANTDLPHAPVRSVSTPAPPADVVSPPTSPRAPLRRTVSANVASLSNAPRVILTLSEPRGYPILQNAISAAVPPRHSSPATSSPSLTPRTRALAITSDSSGRSGGSGPSTDDEEERGRSRSKESPRSFGDRSLTARPTISENATPKPNGEGTPRPLGRRRKGERDREREKEKDKLYDSLSSLSLELELDGERDRKSKTEDGEERDRDREEKERRREHRRRQRESQREKERRRAKAAEAGERERDSPGLLESIFGRPAEGVLSPPGGRRSSSVPPVSFSVERPGLYGPM